MQHSTRTIRSAAACAFAVASFSLSADAQQMRATTAAAGLLATPSGRALATVMSGTAVQAHESRGAFTRVTLRGFVDTSFLGARRDSFAHSVRGTSGTVRLRTQASRSSRILAELNAGMGFSRVTKRGAWAEVERSGWVRTSALSSPEVAAAPQTRPPVAAAVPASVALPAPEPAESQPGALTPSRPVDLRSAPDGPPLASARAGTIVTPLARERGWVRVRVEGWVQERDLVSADSAVQSAPSAADLRADPEAARGKTVSWNVQVLALQYADPLRRDMAPEEPYLLARGPGTESSLLYLAVPPSLLAMAKSIAPLTNVAVTARVRNGRSEPVGVPILDLMRIVQ